jgi:ubiquinone/menaquinone biosynthesis C-methylase UbiE
MAFEADLTTRNAANYAEFLLPHLAGDFRLLDVGCGGGSISVSLAKAVGHVTGVDLDERAFADARDYVTQHGIDNVVFRAGNVYALEFPSDRFDACLCHSMLETLDHPLDALEEIKRTLKPGGILGAACVEYGGLILAGPQDAILRRFYAIRERLWQLENADDPYRGRDLRGLLKRAGFERVVATTKAFCYGTDEAVKSFGIERAHDCHNDWYASGAQKHGLATRRDLDAMDQAWREWSQSSAAYASFAWCRAIGWKPLGSRMTETTTLR